MRRRWLSWTLLFLVPFCFVWNSFLVGWYSIAAGSGASFFMLIFPLGHVAVGLGLAYLVVAMLFNETTISVDRGAVSVAHGPVPWRGNLRLDRSAIRQLYGKKTLSYGKNGVSVTYALWASLTDGRARSLVSGVNLDADQVLYLEHRIETALGIEDEAVPGAMKHGSEGTL